MDSCGEALKQWQLERPELYSNLLQLADDLHGFHLEASKVKATGRSVAMIGTVTRILGLAPGMGLLQLYGQIAQVTGGVTVGVTSIVELYKDWTAIEEAKRLLGKHDAAHENLRKHLSFVGLSMNNLSQHQGYLTDLQFQRFANTAVESLSTALSVAAAAEMKIGGVQTILREIDTVINRDVPSLFDSWLVMKGDKVPRTMQRLRLLKHDLEREEDDLMLQLHQLFISLGL